MAEIKIDSRLFQERISHFASAWKNDLRANHGVFHDAQSILVMMGKVEEVPELHKNNAMHVSRLDATSCVSWTLAIAKRQTRETSGGAVN